MAVQGAAAAAVELRAPRQLTNALLSPARRPYLPGPPSRSHSIGRCVADSSGFDTRPAPFLFAAVRSLGVDVGYDVWSNFRHTLGRPVRARCLADLGRDLQTSTVSGLCVLSSHSVGQRAGACLSAHSTLALSSLNLPSDRFHASNHFTRHAAFSPPSFSYD